jgi:hypothetical protein
LQFLDGEDEFCIDLFGIFGDFQFLCPVSCHLRLCVMFVLLLRKLMRREGWKTKGKGVRVFGVYVVSF